MERQTDCGSETSTFRGNNLNCVNFKPMESESIHCEPRQYSSWNQDAQFRFAAKKDIQAMVEYFQYMAGAGVAKRKVAIGAPCEPSLLIGAPASRTPAANDTSMESALVDHSPLRRRQRRAAERRTSRRIKIIANTSFR